MRLSITRRQYFRAALFVPLVVPFLALLLVSVDLPRGIVAVMPNGFGDAMYDLCADGVYYVLPYLVLVSAIWRPSRTWTVRTFWMLLGGLPLTLAFALGVYAVVGLQFSWQRALEFVPRDLVVGYGQALLIVSVLLLGQLVGWIVDSDVSVVPPESGAHVA